MRIRLTTRCAMFLIAAIGVHLALLRVQLALGVFVASMSCLASLRTFEKVRRSAAEGITIRPAGVLATILRSLLVAFLLLFVPCFVAMIMLPGALPAVTPGGFPTTGEAARAILVVSMLLVPVVICLKRVLW